MKISKRSGLLQDYAGEKIKQIVFETLLELKFNSVAKAFIGIK